MHPQWLVFDCTIFSACLYITTLYIAVSICFCCEIYNVILTFTIKCAIMGRYSSEICGKIKTMKIKRKWLGLALAGMMVFLFVMHLILMTFMTDNMVYWEIASFFDMDIEVSFPTWYSTVVLLFVPAVLLFYIGYCKKMAGDRQAWYWFLLSGVMLFLSINDGAMVHEKFTTLNRALGIQNILDSWSIDLFAWSWWVIYVPVGIVLLATMMKWFLALPRRTQVLMALAVILAFIGQVGLEVFNGFVTNTSGEYVGPVWRGLQKFIGRSGLSLFLFAIVDYIGLLPAKEKKPINIEVV